MCHAFMDACVPVELHAHLYSISCSLVGHVSSQSFCDGGVVGVSAALVNLPGAPVAHQTSRLNPNGHIGNLEGHSLVLVRGLAMQDPRREAMMTMHVQCTKRSWLSYPCVVCKYLDDWLAECLPLHGITKGFFHGSTGQSNGTNCNLGGWGCTVVKTLTHAFDHWCTFTHKRSCTVKGSHCNLKAISWLT